MTRTIRTSDPYQTSIRNFGPAQPPRRAPVDDVDAKLTAIGLQIENLGRDMAVMSIVEREVAQVEMNTLIVKRSALRFEREEIIRKFFYGGHK